VSFIVSTNLHYFGLLLVSVAACGLMVNEGGGVEMMLHGKMIKNGAERGKRVEICLLQMWHVEPEVSCGMFRLDWKIIHGVS
jgi:hypothetical protein